MIEELKARSPRELLDIGDLWAVPKFTRGKSVSILQLEFDILDDHNSLKDISREFFSPEPLKLAFGQLKLAVHATAVGSIMNDAEFGIAPDANYLFAGFSRDYLPYKNGLIHVLNEIIDKGTDAGMKPGDLINISMQFQGPNRGKAAAFPVDSDRQIRLQINELVDTLGYIVVIAAGNSRMDLDSAVVSGDGFRPRPYKDMAASSRAIRVGYTDGKREALERSNYGSCVHLSCPATSVKAACHDYNETIAKGDLIDVFCSGFARSSASAPMTTAAFACIQSMLLEANRPVLNRDQLLDLAQRTGSPVYINGGQTIGVQPAVKSALKELELL